jgi:hypothetical protein
LTALKLDSTPDAPANSADALRQDPQSSLSADDYAASPEELLARLMSQQHELPALAPQPSVLSSLDLEGLAAAISAGQVKNVVVMAGAGIFSALDLWFHVIRFCFPFTVLLPQLRVAYLTFDLSQELASLLASPIFARRAQAYTITCKNTICPLHRPYSA